MKRTIEARARRFAEHYHGIIDHRRKHNGEPYINHLAAVADIVRGVEHTPQMIAAAWLHDVVEYTPAMLDEVRQTFGREIAGMVEALTGPSRAEELSRAERQRIVRARLVMAPPEVKTIKLADIIDNVRCATGHDPKHTKAIKACLKDKAALLPFLRDGNPSLWFFASSAIVLACKRLSSE